MTSPYLKEEQARLRLLDGVYDPTITAFDYPEMPKVPKDRTWLWALACIVCGLSIIAIVTLTVTA